MDFTEENDGLMLLHRFRLRITHHFNSDIIVDVVIYIPKILGKVISISLG